MKLKIKKITTYLQLLFDLPIIHNGKVGRYIDEEEIFVVFENINNTRTYKTYKEFFEDLHKEEEIENEQITFTLYPKAPREFDHFKEGKNWIWNNQILVAKEPSLF